MLIVKILVANLFICLVFFSFSPPVYAEDSQELVDIFSLSLEDLLKIKVTSVSRSEESIIDAPQVITVYTPEQMRLLGLRTINDVLALVPGYDIQRQLRTERIFTRGNRESVLALFDGVPINDIVDNQVHLDRAFQLDNIDHIEITRGAGGVMWGHNAFLGVVNIITKQPTQTSGAQINISRASYDDNQLGFALTKQVNDWSWFVSGHYNSKKNPDINYQYYQQRGIKSVNENSYWADLFVKSQYKNWTFTLRNDWQKQTSPVYDARPYLLTEKPLVERDPLTLAIINYDQQLSDTTKFSARISWMKRKFMLFAPHDPDHQFNQTDDKWNDLKMNRAIADFKWTYQEDKIRAVGGINIDYARNYHSVFSQYPVDGGARINSPVNASAKLRYLSGYGQLKYDYSPTLTLGAGLRAEFSKELYQNDFGGDFKAIAVPNQYLVNINAIYHPNVKHTFKFILSNGLRRPSVEQSSSRVTGFEGNVNVSEEKVYSIEVDHTWQVSSNISWRNNISYNDLRGLLDFRKQGDRQIASNLDRAYIYSYESELNYQINERNNGFINLNYKNGRTRDNETFSIENTNKININIVNRYSIDDGIYWSNIIRYVGKKEDSHLPDNGLAPFSDSPLTKVPAYTTWDTGIVCDKLPIKNIALSFFIYNAFDKEYIHQSRPSRAGLAEKQPGRNFMLRVDYQF
ncbi:MAG: TonB-dependent receptor plug domain-containing protein [Alteromonadaceae bacterium]|nr:TonB-dependent receptor plug domain-containing protein [Alteromonadaceae bacterium]